MQQAVSTPAKAASLPLPKSRIIGGRSAPRTSSLTKSSSRAVAPILRPSSRGKSSKLGSPGGRDETPQERFAKRTIDGAQHRFATSFLRSPTKANGENPVENEGDVVTKSLDRAAWRPAGSAIKASPSTAGARDDVARRSWPGPEAGGLADGNTPAAMMSRKSAVPRSAAKAPPSADRKLAREQSQKNPKSPASRSTPTRGTPASKHSRTPLGSSSSHRKRAGRPSLPATISPASRRRRGTDSARKDKLTPSRQSRLTGSPSSRSQGRTPGRSPGKSPSKHDSNEEAAMGAARLADLCEEDKMKVAKLIEQLMKLGAENEMSAAEFGQERNMLQKNLEDAQKLSTDFREQASDVEQKYSKSLEMIKGYQNRLRSLAEEREEAFQESRRAKLEQENLLSREKRMEEELQEARKIAERRRKEIERFAELERSQAAEADTLRAQLISRQAVSKKAAEMAASRSPTGAQGAGDEGDSLITGPALPSAEPVLPNAEPTLPNAEPTPPNAEPTLPSAGPTASPPPADRVLEEGERPSETEFDEYTENAIRTLTPRTKDALTGVTNEVVQKLEEELTSAREALDRLRMEQSKNDSVLNMESSEAAGGLSGEEGRATRKQFGTPPPGSVTEPSAEDAQRRVRIRGTPEMWDGTTMDAMNEPFVTRGYPNGRGEIRSYDDNDFVNQTEADPEAMSRGFMPPAIPSPSKSISPVRPIRRRGKKMAYKQEEEKEEDLDSLEEFERYRAERMPDEGRPPAIVRMWGQSQTGHVKRILPSKKKKAGKKRVSKVAQVHRNKAKKEAPVVALGSSLTEDYFKNESRGEDFYQASLFDLVDEMESIDLDNSRASIVDGDFGSERSIMEGKENLSVVSSASMFHGTGYRLAPAPEAVSRRRKGKKQGKRPFGKSRKMKLEELDADVWWENVGSKMNPNKNVSKKRPVRIMPPGGRNGDYWGTYSNRFGSKHPIPQRKKKKKKKAPQPSMEALLARLSHEAVDEEFLSSNLADVKDSDEDGKTLEEIEQDLGFDEDVELEEDAGLEGDGTLGINLDEVVGEKDMETADEDEAFNVEEDGDYNVEEDEDYNVEEDEDYNGSGGGAGGKSAEWRVMTR